MAASRPFPIALLSLLAPLALLACGGAEGSSATLLAASEDPRPTVTAGQASAAESAAMSAAARPIEGNDGDYADILAAASGARRILLGESTHGTHEYYRERARLSERLVRDHGVGAIAIEGDWTPVWRLNLYVRGLGGDGSAEQAMAGFTRFPRWMWNNAEFRDFVERLRALNLQRPPTERVGLYGMDVYDLFEARDAVLAYLRSVDPSLHGRAKRHYDCFGCYRTTEAYGEATRGSVSCRKQAEKVRADVREIQAPADPATAEPRFAAVRAAASVAAAEEYFRTAYTGSLAWNVRDQRMAENVEEIAAHVQAVSGRPGKLVMWSHNTHSGDARATFAANRGELNLGQLMRQRHGDAAFLIGFFSYRGTVLAAPEWGESGRVYEMSPALPGSYAAIFHALGRPSFSLLLRGNDALADHLGRSRPERAIGVVYQPRSERLSHYFEARLTDQFDAAIYFDTSRAVTPLRR